MISDPEQSSETGAHNIHLLKLLISVNDLILKGTPYNVILDYLFESLNVVIPYDRIGVALLEKREGKQVLQMDWVKSREKIVHLNLPYSTTNISPSLRQILETNRPRIINDLCAYLEEHPESTPTQLAVNDGIRSSLSYPIRFQNQPIGVIFFSSFKTGTYQQEHATTFQQIADEVSIIINHGKLQKSFMQSATQTKNVNMTLHDLRSPLGILQGFAEISLDRPWFQNLDPEGKLVFETFFRNTRYMIDLVNELSELALLQNNEDFYHPSQINLQDFVTEISQMGHQMADKKEIFFKTVLDSSLPKTCQFDVNKIKRAILNLISNAIKFSNRKSEVGMRVFVKENRLYFAIEDQGPGIPASELGNLFQEFGKTSVRPTEGEMSTGQGLAIAKKIIDQHRGHIQVQSEVRKGSIFSFWLPL